MGKGLRALEELRMLNKFVIENKATFVGESLYQIIEQELKVFNIILDKFDITLRTIKRKPNGDPLFRLLVLRSKDTGEETKISVSKQKYELLKEVLRK